jgi:hypothetical protein
MAGSHTLGLAVLAMLFVPFATLGMIAAGAHVGKRIRESLTVRPPTRRSTTGLTVHSRAMMAPTGRLP